MWYSEAYACKLLLKRSVLRSTIEINMRIKNKYLPIWALGAYKYSCTVEKIIKAQTFLLL